MIYQPNRIITARSLRKNQTDAEKILWKNIRNRNFAGYKFKRQFPIGKYIVDFVCFAHKLAIEIDGGQHMDNLEKDLVRTKYIESHGFKVIRFWNNEVMENIESVLETILVEIKSISPHPFPLPVGEGDN